MSLSTDTSKSNLILGTISGICPGGFFATVDQQITSKVQSFIQQQNELIRFSSHLVTADVS